MNTKTKKPANENLSNDEAVFTKPVDLSRKVMYFEDEGGIEEELLEDLDHVFHKKFKDSFYKDLEKELKEIDDIYEMMCKEKNSKKRKEISHKLFQVVHKLRGQGGSFGYELISVVGNNVCRFLEDNETIEDYHLPAIKLCLDTLNVVVKKDIKGKGGEKGKELVSGLDALEQKLSDSNKEETKNLKIEDFF